MKTKTKPKDNWIPASKKPRTSGDYIVALKGCKKARSGFYADYLGWVCGFDDPNKITHWQHFPKPPKQIKPKKGK